MTMRPACCDRAAAAMTSAGVPRVAAAADDAFKIAATVEHGEVGVFAEHDEIGGGGLALDRVDQRGVK